MITNIKNELISIIEKYQEKGVSKKQIQDIFIGISKEKLNYDNYVVVLEDDNEMRLQTIEESLLKIVNKIDTMKEDFDEFKKESEKDSFIKGLDSTLTGVGKEINNGLQNFGDWINRNLDDI